LQSRRAVALYSGVTEFELRQEHIVLVNFMFGWRCISIHPCNENQYDALFILSLFCQSTCTCFGHICSPSSGCLLYIVYTTNVTCCAFQL